MIVKGGSAECARVGDSSVSETLYPAVYFDEKLNFALADMPGFDDTRGGAEEICAAASTQMLAKQLRSIKGLAVLCSHALLTNPRVNAYREPAIKIGRMIGLNPELANNVVFILSKPKKGVKKRGKQCPTDPATQNKTNGPSPAQKCFKKR